VAGDLRLSYSQFEELETFARFGTQLDEETNRTLERGRRVRQVLKQPQYATMRVAAQIAVLVAVNEGVFDPVPLDEIAGAEKKVVEAVLDEQETLCRRIEKGEDMGDEDMEKLAATARKALEQR